MSAQPETIANVIIEKINAARDRADISDIEFAAWKRDAKALAAVEPQTGYIALGMIASLEGNACAVQLNHETALRYGPSDWVANYNYAVSLKNILLLDKAITYAEKACEYAATSVEIGSAGTLLLDLYLSRFMFCKANELIKSLANNNIQLPLNKTFDIEIKNLPSVYNFMKRCGISDPDLAPFADCVLEIVKLTQYRITAVPSISEFEGDGQLSVRLLADDSADTVSNLSWAIAECLASKEIPAFVNDKVLLSCWKAS